MKLPLQLCGSRIEDADGEVVAVLTNEVGGELSLRNPEWSKAMNNGKELVELVNQTQEK